MMTLAVTSSITAQLCYNFMHDLNYKDVRQLQKWFHNTSTVCIPPALAVAGSVRILAMFRAIFKKYDCIEWQVKEIFRLSENRFVIFTDSEGFLKDGTPYSNSLITDVSFNDKGQIDRLSDYFKNTAIFCTKNG